MVISIFSWLWVINNLLGFICYYETTFQNYVILSALCFQSIPKNLISQKWIRLKIFILYNTGGCLPLFRVSVGHKFYIQIALPISPEIMDGFCCSRCLNDRIEVPEMMDSFLGGTTTPLVVKIWTKQPWVENENLRDFDRNFAQSRGKIWLWLFYNFFCVIVPQF